MASNLKIIVQNSNPLNILHFHLTDSIFLAHTYTIAPKHSVTPLSPSIYAYYFVFAQLQTFP